MEQTPHEIETYPHLETLSAASAKRIVDLATYGTEMVRRGANHTFDKILAIARNKLQVTRFPDVYGRFVAVPGLALVLIGNLHVGGLSR
ncbi:hypothetical protein [Dyadobacter arcticus]|uniref:Uncharacterized protein n=1 Tax=Dyadobacter arcticus TaxID=1078754 RepID=A0ABX0USG6_9BACT|nr:hypothetical protein [Dyadobacter arcticus]NIJ55154.1 hypothetical protein [Dyadobacter arcticus]